ncbi:MAG TPA: Flp pilus assembly protein CpaB [Erysipelotrichaceae bacterium]|nr:Flp pilus assembly protein CpaB [Erysipelotrichaceae bacterium]
MKKIRLLAVISAIAVMISLYLFINDKSQKEKEQMVEYKTIIIANSDISENTVITEDMLTKINIPSEGVHVDTVLELDEALGKMTTTKIYAREPILNTKLIDKDESGTVLGLAYILPDGLRGMSVDVEYSSGVSSMLKVGNRVDILYNGLVSYNVKSGGENIVLSQPFTTLLLQNIKITALDSNLNTDGIKVSDSKVAYMTVTLELSPQDSVKLAYGIKNGSVFLTLRPQGDYEWVETTDIVLDDIVDKAKIIESIKSYYEN